MHNPIDIQALHQRLRLDATTGFLYWKSIGSPGSWDSKHAGQRAGADKGRGYRVLRLGGINYQEHRIVFALAYGRDPGEFVVDHINGIRSDNRPSNLQIASNTENVRKRHKLNANNTSNEHGVYFHKSAGKWSATIKVNRRAAHLGVFDTKKAARAARVAAENEHYGKFKPDEKAMKRRAA